MKDFLIDWGERLIVLLLLAAFAVANLATGDWTNYLLVLLESVTAFFILIRRKAVSVSDSPLDWFFAVAGTMAPLLARPGHVSDLWVASALVVVGGVLSFGAKASLNRRFGMAPANRGVQANWAYALVRHPMYLGYIIAQIGYLLHNPTPYNAILYIVAWGLQIARVLREEGHLMLDEAYRSYALRTRYRLVPGIF